MTTAQRTTPGLAPAGVDFADPDWRGEAQGEGAPDEPLRPLASLTAQEQRLGDWIRGGACYGWLDAYEARRAAFELQSVRAQRARDRFGAGCRRAVQRRLDRLDEALDRARAACR